MQNDFLTELLGNVVKAKILRYIVHNDKDTFSVAELAKRIGSPQKNVGVELEKMKKVGIVKSENIVSKKKVNGRTQRVSYWSYDVQCKHASALSLFVHDVSPPQFHDIEKAIKGAGRMHTVVLSGVFLGDPTRPADLLIVGDYVNERRLERVVKTFESKMGKEIRYAILSTPEFRYRLTIHDRLVRDTLDYPHRVLINKGNLI